LKAGVCERGGNEDVKIEQASGEIYSNELTDWEQLQFFNTNLNKVFTLCVPCEFKQRICIKKAGIQAIPALGGQWALINCAGEIFQTAIRISSPVSATGLQCSKAIMADRIKYFLFNLDKIIQVSVQMLWGVHPMPDLMSAASIWARKQGEGPQKLSALSDNIGSFRPNMAVGLHPIAKDRPITYGISY
jgi:hypothetical protein